MAPELEGPGYSLHCETACLTPNDRFRVAHDKRYFKTHNSRFSNLQSCKNSTGDEIQLIVFGWPSTFSWTYHEHKKTALQKTTIRIYLYLQIGSWYEIEV